MVSWGDAFYNAIVIVAYAIGFWIIGAIIIGIGYVFFTERTGTPNLLSALMYAIGAIIIIFGGLASILKVLTDMIGEEISTRGSSSPASEEPKS